MRGRLVVLALAAPLAYGACRAPAEEHEEPIAVEVKCVPADRQVVSVIETLLGRVTAPPGGDLPVASQVPGRILRVTVREGDRVAAGALVALVDDTASRDALRQSEAAVAEARAAQINARATLNRTRELVTRGIAAKQELDDAVSRGEQAEASVNAAVAAADLATRTLGRVQVRSTFDGLVTRVWRGPGALVDGTAATPVIELAATTAEFDADATDRQLVDVAAGQQATVTTTAGGAPIPGTVRARSAALDPATGLGLVRVAIDPPAPLTLGAFGTVAVQTRVRQGVLVVPAAAMRGAVADGAEVVVCARGKAEVRTVHVGWRDDERIEIAGGLAEGERVAVDHVLGLQTGSPLVEAKP